MVQERAANLEQDAYYAMYIALYVRSVQKVGKPDYCCCTASLHFYAGIYGAVFVKPLPTQKLYIRPNFTHWTFKPFLVGRCSEMKGKKKQGC